MIQQGKEQAKVEVEYRGQCKKVYVIKQSDKRKHRLCVVHITLAVGQACGRV